MPSGIAFPDKRPYRLRRNDGSIITMSTTYPQPGESPVILTQDLVRTYGSGKNAYEAVSSINFHVNRGEVYGLLGTNGAGKTSTLEVIEGLVSASSGAVQVFGKDPFKQRQQVRPEMGIMLQSGGLPSQLTVWETITMWQGTCSHPRDPVVVLKEVDLLHRKDVRVGVLSGGEQRRLDLGCALVGDPTLLFLDEPTTGLDPESRRNVWKLLVQLKERGVTMILTTHYLEEAEMLCDRIAIMHAGTFAREGTLSELVATVSAEISFESQLAPPQLIGTTVASEGDEHTIYTDELQADTLQILEWARENSVELKHFAAHPATLEQLFLQIAGSTPVDA